MEGGHQIGGGMPLDRGRGILYYNVLIGYLLVQNQLTTILLTCNTNQFCLDKCKFIGNGSLYFYHTFDILHSL